MMMGATGDIKHECGGGGVRRGSVLGVGGEDGDPCARRGSVMGIPCQGAPEGAQGATSGDETPSSPSTAARMLSPFPGRRGSNAPLGLPSIPLPNMERRNSNSTSRNGTPNLERRNSHGRSPVLERRNSNGRSPVLERRNSNSTSRNGSPEGQKKSSPPGVHGCTLTDPAAIAAAAVAAVAQDAVAARFDVRLRAKTRKIFENLTDHVLLPLLQL
eukprot:2088878-Prymnesium_polylepis.1